MLSTDVTVTGDLGSHTYSLVSIKDGNSVRSDPTAPQGEPRYLSVKHTDEKQGGVKVRRHLVRFDLNVNSAEGETATASAYVVLVNPQRITTRAHQLHLVSLLKNFLSTTNTEKVLNGEP